MFSMDDIPSLPMRNWRAGMGAGDKGPLIQTKTPEWGARLTTRHLLMPDELVQQRSRESGWPKST